jgi:hypothetical protein
MVDLTDAGQEKLQLEAIARGLVPYMYGGRMVKSLMVARDAMARVVGLVSKHHWVATQASGIVPLKGLCTTTCIGGLSMKNAT